MQNGTGVGRKRTQDSSSSLAVFSLCHLTFRNTVCSVSFVSLLGESSFEELQGSMDSPQETWSTLGIQCHGADTHLCLFRLVPPSGYVGVNLWGSAGLFGSRRYQKYKS